MVIQKYLQVIFQHSSSHAPIYKHTHTHARVRTHTHTHTHTSTHWAFQFVDDKTLNSNDMCKPNLEPEAISVLRKEWQILQPGKIFLVHLISKALQC